MSDFHVEDRGNRHLTIERGIGFASEVVALYCPTGEGIPIERSAAFNPEETVLLIKKENEREWYAIREFYRELVVESKRYVQVQIASKEVMKEALSIPTEKALGLYKEVPVARGPPNGVVRDERDDGNKDGKDRCWNS